MSDLIDLHAHTVVSDGTLTPTRLVELAAARGLAALALTDHDHVGGLVEARRAAQELGLEVVSGIELSATWRDEDVHLLGYLIDDQDERLLARLEGLREARGKRIVAMVEKLRSLGVPVTMEDVGREIGRDDAAPGRPHVARAIVRAGAASSIQDAFDRWIGDGCPAHVPKEKLSLAEAIALVHGAGGLAVVAHPGLLDRWGDVVAEGVAHGLDGVEVEHPDNPAPVRDALREVARRHGLVETGGSDFHGENKPDFRLGSGVDDNVRVTMDVLEALKRRKARREAQRPR